MTRISSVEEVASHTRVEVHGRHTARGDAVTAAQVFQVLTKQLCKTSCPVQTLIRRQTGLVSA